MLSGTMQGHIEMMRYTVWRKSLESSCITYPYSPNLNPVERVWKLMHENVRYNKYYGKFSEFTESTLEFFKTIGRKKTILRARITDNFQILHSPLFAS